MKIDPFVKGKEVYLPMVLIIKWKRKTTDDGPCYRPVSQKKPTDQYNLKK